jgi:hypothetical protein
MRIQAFEATKVARSHNRRRSAGAGRAQSAAPARSSEGADVKRASVGLAAALVAILASSNAAHAAGPAACDDPARCPIPNNRYALDLFQGPILAPLRVTGIAGAYAGYAEGIEGMVANAAAPAVREPFSASWLEADVSASVSIPITLFKNNDFDNSGQIDFDYSNFLYITAGGLLQLGMFGLGANAEVKRYTLTGSDQTTEHVVVGKYHVLGAVRLLGDQLMLGAGARIVTLGIDSSSGSGGPTSNFTIAGLAPELGFLLRPDFRSFRIGGTFRFPVNAGALTGDARAVDANGVERLGALVVPDRVVLPWELELGVVLQVGPQPLNPAWIDPHEQEAAFASSIAAQRRRRAEAYRAELAEIADPIARNLRAAELRTEWNRLEAEERAALAKASTTLTDERRARYWNWPREHLLLTAELLVTGAVDQGVSILRFLGQNQPESAGLPSQIGTSGRVVNFSPRFGIETEPIPTLVHTRFGSYYEPKRFTSVGVGAAEGAGTVGRQHFTFGADLRLFKTTWFGLVPEVTYKLQTSFDIAPRYQSASLGIGVWH